MATRSRDRSASATSGTGIVARGVQGDSAFVPLLGTHANESMPGLSPDGHWLAYVSDESGSWQLVGAHVRGREPSCVARARLRDAALMAGVE